jgi:hypothetical protein
MKLDSIKKKALGVFLTAFDRIAAMPGVGLMKHDPSYTALLPFVRMLGTEREDLRAFADQFGSAEHGDRIANGAVGGNPWRQMLLRAREEGVKVIDAWDVRCIGRLIDLFPESVPKQYRNAAMTCYMADDEDSTWMVDFDTSRRRHRAAA